MEQKKYLRKLEAENITERIHREPKKGKRSTFMKYNIFGSAGGRDHQYDRGFIQEAGYVGERIAIFHTPLQTQ